MLLYNYNNDNPTNPSHYNLLPCLSDAGGGLKSIHCAAKEFEARIRSKGALHGYLQAMPFGWDIGAQG